MLYLLSGLRAKQVLALPMAQPKEESHLRVYSRWESRCPTCGEMGIPHHREQFLRLRKSLDTEERGCLTSFQQAVPSSSVCLHAQAGSGNILHKAG